MIKTGRLQHSMDFITQNPETHNQSWWGRETACGTTLCLAGHIVTAAGYELEWIGGRASFTTDGRWIPELAQELVGLSDHGALSLFFMANDLDDLWMRVEALTDGVVSRRWTTDETCIGIDELEFLYRSAAYDELRPE